MKLPSLAALLCSLFFLFFSPPLKASDFLPFAEPASSRMEFQEYYAEYDDGTGSGSFFAAGQISVSANYFSLKAPDAESGPLEITAYTPISIQFTSEEFGTTVVFDNGSTFDTFTYNPTTKIGKATFPILSPSGIDENEDGVPDTLGTVTVNWNSTAVGFSVSFLSRKNTEIFAAAQGYAGMTGSFDASPLEFQLTIEDRSITRKIFFYSATGTQDANGLNSVAIKGKFDTTAPIVYFNRPLVSSSNWPASSNSVTVYYPSVAIEGGIADDQSGPSQVMVKVNDLPEQVIDATDLENWSYSDPDNTLCFNPGLNTITVKAEDVDSNVSYTKTAKVTYSLKSPLLLSSTGSGSLAKSGSLSISGSTLQTTGSNVSITAIPAEGWVFAGWKGHLGMVDEDSLHGEPISEAQAIEPTITFPMLPFATLKATFKPNEFLPNKGLFAGTLFSGTDPRLGGIFQLTLTPTGSFTGKFTSRGVTYNLKGRFTNFSDDLPTVSYSGTATGAAGIAPVTVELTLDYGGTRKVSGTVTFSDGSTATVHSNQWDKTPLASGTGSYTFLLPTPEAGSTLVPQGTGYGTVTISPVGAVRLTGVLPDATGFSTSCFIDKESSFRFFLPLYPAKKGLLAGEVFLENLEGISDFRGVLEWCKPVTKASRYPQELSSRLTMIGSRYQRPLISGSNVAPGFALGNVYLSIFASGSNATLLSSTTSLVNTTPNHYSGILPNPNKLALSVTPSSGLFSGSFTTNRVSTSFKGAVFQKQSLAAGLFSNPTQTGAVLIKTGTDASQTILSPEPK